MRATTPLFAAILLHAIASPLHVFAAPAGVRAQPATRDAAPPLPDGYWGQDRVDAILDRTLRLRLEPDLSGLDVAERRALDALLRVGEILQKCYESSRHPRALEALAALETLHAQRGSPLTADLLALYRLFQGPIATTLDNERLAFLPVEPETPGKNVYPPGLTREELDAWLESHPQRRNGILDERGIVRRGTRENISADLATLEKHPVLAVLHPEVADRLKAIGDPPTAWYTVPHAVAWGDDMVRSHALLRRAASAIDPVTPDFAAYLRNRGRDLLTNDYESGDASWVTGNFGRLNAQIGSYETYDDELYGVKSFFGVSLLLRDEEATRRLTGAMKGIQAIEESLPYEGHIEVRDSIPVGVYDVIADFGQARGTNTATILPNAADHVRKYGRTILLRGNILRHPDLFEISRSTFAAGVVANQSDHLTPDGEFERTLWHEVGHYLGPRRTRDGTDLSVALTPFADLMEEMKADLVSLYAAEALHRAGYHDARTLRALYAGGVRRVLQSVRPRRTQPYQTMQLMQMNFFLENGLLSLEEGRLRIHHDVYHEVVGRLLRQVLELQQAGDRIGVEAFVDRYGVWAEPHEAIAERIRQSARYRYRLVTYAALGE